MTARQNLFSIAKLLLAMVSIQAGASLAKGLFEQLRPSGVTALRLVFAAVLMALAFRPWRQRLALKALGSVAGYGAALGVMNLTFYLAVERIPLGITVALEFMGPLGVTLALSRRPSDFVWVALATCGVLLLSPLGSTAGLDPVGVAWACAAAACWALYIVLGKRASAGMAGGTAAALGMIVAAVVVAPVGFAMAPQAATNLGLWPTALAVAVLSSALPYSLEMLALKDMNPRSFGLLMSLEPAVAALSGWAYLDENLHPAQWLAIACIVVASGGSALGGRGPVEVRAATAARPGRLAERR